MKKIIIVLCLLLISQSCSKKYLEQKDKKQVEIIAKRNPQLISKKEKDLIDDGTVEIKTIYKPDTVYIPKDVIKYRPVYVYDSKGRQQAIDSMANIITNNASIADSIRRLAFYNSVKKSLNSQNNCPELKKTYDISGVDSNGNKYSGFLRFEGGLPTLDLTINAHSQIVNKPSITITTKVTETTKTKTKKAEKPGHFFGVPWWAWLIVLICATILILYFGGMIKGIFSLFKKG